MNKCARLIILAPLAVPASSLSVGLANVECWDAATVVTSEQEASL